MSVAATILLCLYLPVPVIMLWIHAPIRLWRRMGLWSYAIHAPVYLALVTAVALGHPIWSRAAWEWPAALRIAGVVVVAAAAVMFALTYREIDTWTAMGGREIAPGAPHRLLTSGIYGVIRHPRYAVLVVAGTGNFLLTGYPALLAALVFTAACTFLVARIEDAELESRFGEAFRDYRRRVPAWIPRV